MCVFVLFLWRFCAFLVVFLRGGTLNGDGAVKKSFTCSFFQSHHNHEFKLQLEAVILFLIVTSFGILTLQKDLSAAEFDTGMFSFVRNCLTLKLVWKTFVQYVTT